MDEQQGPPARNPQNPAGDQPQNPASGAPQTPAGDSTGGPPRLPEKDPSDWVTGEEPMTGPQASYLETLCRESGEQFDPNLTKAQASRRIDELQQRTGRQGS